MASYQGDDDITPTEKAALNARTRELRNRGFNATNARAVAHQAVVTIGRQRALGYPR